MEKLRVLMLGPGVPSRNTSGLGVAAHHIAQYLNKKVELTIIQPDEQLESKTINQVVLRSDRHSFTEETLVREIVRLNVGPIDELAYYGRLGTSIELRKSEIKRDLISYTREILKKSEPLSFDLIYAHDWTTLQAAIGLKEKTGKPLVIHFHSLDYDRMAGKDRSWVYDLEKEALNHADAVITVSRYSAGILSDHYGLAEELIHPIHNGLEAYDKIKHSKKVKEDIILFVGRLTEQKGPGHFLEIAERIHEKNENTRFVMVGTGEKQKEILESGAYQNFAHKFHLTGYVDQEKLQEFYAISSVYCMPSVSEPFGLSAIEAAHAGLPVVLSKQSGAAEVLQGSLTADFWEIEDFANKILHLLKDKKACKKIVEKNHESLQSISWENTVNEIMDVFISTLK